MNSLTELNLMNLLDECLIKRNYEVVESTLAMVEGDFSQHDSYYSKMYEFKAQDILSQERISRPYIGI